MCDVLRAGITAAARLCCELFAVIRLSVNAVAAIPGSGTRLAARGVRKLHLNEVQALEHKSLPTVYQADEANSFYEKAVSYTKVAYSPGDMDKQFLSLGLVCGGILKTPSGQISYTCYDFRTQSSQIRY
jgi:hypothetical protein